MIYYFSITIIKKNVFTFNGCFGRYFLFGLLPFFRKQFYGVLLNLNARFISENHIKWILFC